MKKHEPDQHEASKIGLNIVVNGGTSPDHVQALIDAFQDDLLEQGIDGVPDKAIENGKQIIFNGSNC